jgi:hypothetical protein
MFTLNPPVVPRTSGTWHASSLLVALKSHLGRVWVALEHYGQRRAARELALTANRIEASRPELAAQLRALARANRNQ